MPKKYTYDEVKKIFFDRNCILLEKKYIDNKTRMNYVCECGNKGYISLKKLLIGQRCNICAEDKRSNKKRKFTVNDVKVLFEMEGYKFAETEKTKINVLDSIKCICPMGHINNTIVSSFLNGHRCKICSCTGIKNHKWNPNRDQIKLNCLIRKKCYSMLHYCFKAMGQKKKDKTQKILGYTPKKLQEHIENHPNWNYVKNLDWHLDHIFPIKAFIEHGINDLKIINALDNLRPIKKEDNLSKNDKYSKKAFRKWLSLHQINLIETK